MSIDDGIDMDLRVHRLPVEELNMGMWGNPFNQFDEAVKRARADDAIREKQYALRTKEWAMDKDKKIQELQEDLRLAEHRAFAAEVGERRAQQKRRNQKKQLKQLHQAISDKNNQIRNQVRILDSLQSEVQILRSYVPAGTEPGGSRVADRVLTFAEHDWGKGR